MNKQEFIGGLERALRGAGASEALIWDNINYYSSYFETEKAKGRTEAEVAGELGDPRLIAKTIIGVREDGTYEDSDGTFRASFDGYGDRNESCRDQDRPNRGFRAELGENGWDVRWGRFKINSWYGYLTMAVLVFAVISLVMAVIGGIFSLVAPVLMPVLIILLVIRLFNGRK